MGQVTVDPYTAPALSGFNSDPPADDGSAVASNLASWQDIIDELLTPMQNHIDAINSAVDSAFGAVPTLADDQANQFTGSIGFGSSELTIASGAVTPTRTRHTVDTESDASTDDLDSMGVGSVYTGAVVLISAANTGRTIVCTHQTGSAGTGRLNNADAASVSLDDDIKLIAYELRADGDWYELWRSSVGAASASAAEMEAASSTSVYVSPSLQHRHPKHPKAWVRFNGITPAINLDSGISTIDDDGTGDYGVNYDTAMSSTSYGATGLVDVQLGTNNSVRSIAVDSFSTGSLEIQTLNATTPEDCEVICLDIYGDQ